VHVLAVTPRAVEAAVELAAARAVLSGVAAPDLAALLGTRVLAVFEPSGALARIEFPAGVTGADRASIAEILYGLQVVLPPGAGAAWDTRERDAGGYYRAAYRREGDGVEKVRTAYLAGGEPGAPRREIVRSRATAAPARDHGWLAALAADEGLRMRDAGGNVVVESQTHITLRFLPGAPAPLPPGEDTPGSLRAALARAGAAGAGFWETRARRLQAAAFEAQGTTLAALVAAVTSDPKPMARKHELAAYLKTFPSEAAKLPALVAATRDTAARARLVNALELAGTPEAQRALGAILTSPAQADQDRLRAVVAMAGLGAPDAATVDLLWAQVSSAAGGISEELSNTSLLALGTLSHNTPPERGAAIRARLRDELARAAGPGTTRIVLHALANAGEAAAAAQVEPYLAAPSPMVREAAAEALGALAAGEARPALAAALAAEPEAGVRRSLVLGLAGLPPDEAAMAAVRAALAREPDAGVRRAMTEYLGAHQDAFPGNRPALRAQMPRETDAATLKRLVWYVRH
jgi:HEAT repeat protein